MRFFEVNTGAEDAIMSAAMIAQQRASAMGKQGKLSMRGFLQMLDNAGVNLDYESFKSIFDKTPKLQNVIDSFSKDSITFASDADDEGADFEKPTTDMPDDERVSRMAQRAMRTREDVSEAPVMTADYVKQKFEQLTANNEHGAAAVLIANAYGTDLEVRLLKAINAVHNERGHIEREEQQLRDSIVQKYYQEMMGESINEGMEDKIRADIKAGMSTDAIIGKYANKRTTNTDEIRKMIQKIKFAMFKNNESVEERSLTKPEKAKMRSYEKKIDKADFIERYGKEKGEPYYYATITKMAKKNA